MTTAGGSDAVDVEDLTARARIRDAALRHFAEDGFERATIRAIARTAGVSPGLVRHHFGSKEALRAAVDDHVLRMVRRFNDEALASGRHGNLSFAAAARPALRPVQRYLLRALLDGSKAAAKLFDEMVEMAEPWMPQPDETTDGAPVSDRRTRAALITAMAAGVGLLHEHVSRALGVDMFSDEGDRRVAVAMLDIYSHALITTDMAASARAGLDRPGTESPR
ncbi:MAG TPA: TetR family transcriptional regulator [Micromonosporaceae bacterium]